MNASESRKSHIQVAKLELTAQLNSLGRQGLSSILSMFLPVVSNSHQYDIQKSAMRTASQGVQEMFDALFTDGATGRPADVNARTGYHYVTRCEEQVYLAISGVSTLLGSVGFCPRITVLS
jgi:hypothetical protein